MSTPTIEISGTASELLLITDNDGNPHRIPKTSVGNIINSGNEHTERIEIHYAGGEIVLIFESAEEVVTFLLAVDAQY